jgi:hypothetical protein
MMEKHPELLDEGLVRRNGTVTPFNAADVLAAVVEEYDAPLLPRQKARLGKAAKELLEAGFDPQVVGRAMFQSLLRARIDLVPNIALEIQNARGGRHKSYQAWQEELRSANRQAQPEDTIRRALREAFTR